MKKTILAMLFCLTSTSLSYSATYYVRPSGGSYGLEDGSSYDNAYDGYADINWSVISANLPSILYVCGTQTTQLLVGTSGTDEAHRLTIRGDYGPDPAIIDGGGSSSYGIYVQGRNYITITSFTAISEFYYGVAVREGSTYITVQYCIVSSCIRTAIYSASCDNITIQYNTCSNSGMEHGIYLANNSDDCIIRGNECFQNNWTGINVNGDGYLLERVLIDGNKIHDNNLTLDLSCVRDSTITNNLIYNSKTKGMVLWDTGYGNGYGSCNNKIVNNTFHMTNIADREGIYISAYSTGNKVVNNIFYTDKAPCIVVVASAVTGTVIDYNHYYNTQTTDITWDGINYTLANFKSTVAQELNSTQGNPMFLNIAEGDFNLQSGSLCLDSGTSTNAPYNDINGVSRPQGSFVDKGAYEKVVGVGGSISAPSVLNSVVTSTGSVSLSWTDNSNNETGFKIERKTGVGGSYSQISLAGANVTTYNDLALNSGTIYYYRVRATDGIIDSMYSNEKSIVTLGYSVNAPSNLNGVVISSTTVSLDWTDNSLDEQGFKIERKIGSGGSYSQIGTVGENVKVFDDTGLTTETTYYYRIRAYNGSANSDYLSEVSVVLVYAYTIPAPSQLEATVLAINVISLSWADNSPDEIGFKIERKTDSVGSYSHIGTVGTNIISFSDSGLSLSSTYYYRVKAYNGSGDSGYSNEAYAFLESDSGGIVGTAGGDAAKISIVSGEIKVVGSTKNRGTVNPDDGDTAEIHFKGKEAGKFECRIFTLAGEIVWEDTKEGLSEGMFRWVPKDVAAGGYVVHVKGPGVNVKGKVLVMR